nr:hypothetical protein [Tanacetum cinerariifolium]
RRYGDGVLVEPAVVLVDPSSTSTGRTALAVESVFEDGGIKERRYGDGVLVEPAVVLVDPSSTSTGRTALAVESVFEDAGIKEVNLACLLYTEKDDKLVAMAAWTQEVVCLCLFEETLNCFSDRISLLSDDEAS